MLFFSNCYTPDYKQEDTIIPPLSAQGSNSICDEIMDVTDSGSGLNEEGTYAIGNTITSEHLIEEFNYCYPADSVGRSFSFSNHQNKVFMIEMSATW